MRTYAWAFTPRMATVLPVSVARVFAHEHQRDARLAMESRRDTLLAGKALPRADIGSRASAGARAHRAAIPIVRHGAKRTARSAIATSRGCRNMWKERGSGGGAGLPRHRFVNR